MAQIYINAKHTEETRVITTSNNMLVGYEQERAGEENQRGNLYKGQVTRIEESLNAAFIDLGENKNGFLPLREILPALKQTGDDDSSPGIKEGDFLLVQVKKDYSTERKGSGLTTNISLAGAFLILHPHKQRYRVSISSQGDYATRKKMTEVVNSLVLDDNMSLILRTAGLERTKEELEWDLNSYLLKLWQSIQTAYNEATSPTLLYHESTLMRVVRDYLHSQQHKVICDDQSVYENLQKLTARFFPDNLDSIALHTENYEMVPGTIEQQIDHIFQRTITTPSGCGIVFDSTEALVAIDVNSGRMRTGANIEETALAANMEAAEHIALHLKLRNLGGLIVVDFIDMGSEEHHQKLEKHFFNLLRQDKARIRCTNISQFGLIEVSRQRLSRSLVSSQQTTCYHCGGTGQVERPYSFAIRLLRKIRTLAHNENTVSLNVQAPQQVAIYLLNEKRTELRDIENDCQCNVVIVPNPNLQPPDFQIKPVHGNQAISDSYDLMEAKQQPQDKELKPRRVQPQQPSEAAVNMRPPATVVPSSGLWNKIVSFFTSDDETTPQKKPQQKSGSGRGQGGRGRNRSGRGGDNRGGRGRGGDNRNPNANNEQRNNAQGSGGERQGSGRGRSGRGRGGRGGRDRGGNSDANTNNPANQPKAANNKPERANEKVANDKTKPAATEQKREPKPASAESKPAPKQSAPAATNSASSGNGNTRAAPPPQSSASNESKSEPKPAAPPPAAPPPAAPKPAQANGGNSTAPAPKPQQQSPKPDSGWVDVARQPAAKPSAPAAAANNSAPTPPPAPKPASNLVRVETIKPSSSESTPPQ